MPCNRLVFALAVGAVALTSATTARAQGFGNDTLSAIVPVTPADSGRTSSAFTDFSRYSAAACERMVFNATGTVRRHRNEALSGSFAVRQLTEWNAPFPPVVIAAARTCATHIDPRIVPVSQLRTALRVFVFIDDSVRVQQTLDRWLALDPSATSRGQALFELVDAYMSTRPMRLAEAQAATRRVDALGRGAALWQVEAHSALSFYWTVNYNLEQIVAEGKAASVAYTQLPDSLLGVGFAPASFAAARTAQALLDAYGATVLDTLRTMMVATFQRKTSPEQLQAMTAMLTQLARPVEAYGQSVAPLTAKYTYDLGDRATRPTTGLVSLLYRFDPNCGAGCETAYHALGTLAARYGDTIQITLVAQTHGHLPFSDVLTPDQEAPAIRTYARNILALPFGLLVEDSPMLVLPDGRQVPGRTPATDLFGNASALVADRQGKLRWIGNIDVLSRVDAAVRRAIDASGR
jgi:hypothetical protein